MVISQLKGGILVDDITTMQGTITDDTTMMLEVIICDVTKTQWIIVDNFTMKPTSGCRAEMGHS